MCLRVKKIRFASFLIAIFLLTKFGIAGAQELEPRAYTNIPVGINFVLGGYAYSTGGVIFDPSVPLDNAHINTHGALSAYCRSIKVGNMSGKVDIFIPYAWLSGTAEYDGQTVSRTVNGFGDARLRMSLNFIGAPALSFADYKNYKQNFVAGASLQIYVPTGQYDPLRLVNIGTNRFTIKPELGVSKKFGPLQAELTGGVAFYTTNFDFYQGKTRKQAPIGSIQAHINFNFKKGIWAAIDGTYYWGGHSTTDGVEGDDLQKNTRLGCNLNIPVSIRHSIRLYYSTGVWTRTGTDFDLVGALWQYRWSRDFPKAGK
jgi:hypothetical protein